jgi:hypothetical protein
LASFAAKILEEFSFGEWPQHVKVRVDNSQFMFVRVIGCDDKEVASASFKAAVNVQNAWKRQSTDVLWFQEPDLGPQPKGIGASGDVRKRAARFRTNPNHTLHIG